MPDYNHLEKLSNGDYIGLFADRQCSRHNADSEFATLNVQKSLPSTVFKEITEPLNLPSYFFFNLEGFQGFQGSVRTLIATI